MAARRWWQTGLLSLVVLLIATACLDDTDNRQFATDPRTPQPTPTQAPEEEIVASPLVPAAVGSPEALVQRRGAPAVAYLDVAGTLRAVTRSEIAAVVDAPVLAFAASPSGDRVAVVVPGSDGAVDLRVFAASGDEVAHIENVMRAVAATPAAASTDVVDAGGFSLSWAPQEGHVLLAHRSGRLVDITLDGEISEIETATPLGELVGAHWSPRGDRIAVVQRGDGGYGSAALIDPSVAPARVVVIAPIGKVMGERPSVEGLAWLPGGEGVLYRQARLIDGEPRDGQLVRWDQASNSTQVVATGGQLGPTGSIQAFAIAPDGKAVAYITDIRSGDAWSFGGLYVRSLEHGQTYRVQVSPGVEVTTLRWLEDGLAWAGVATGADGVETVVVRWIDGAGRTEAIGDIRIVEPAPALASPVASPAASPVPVIGATPMASPVVRPAATPAG